jgi:uncharacterized membrane protein YeaQ/YmgE (transglycosylase-associated protein family)
MGWLSWIVVGLLAGILAKWILPGEQKAGFLVTTALGIVGGFFGGWIMSIFSKTGMTGFNLWSLLVATLGAVVVLAVYGFVRKKV